MTPPGGAQLIIILVIVLLIFGGRRLPELASAIGESVRRLREGLADDADDAREG